MKFRISFIDQTDSWDYIRHFFFLRIDCVYLYFQGHTFSMRRFVRLCV
jgi:hypothetical protein